MTLDLTSPSLQSNGALQDSLGNTVLFALTDYPGGSGATTSFLRLRAGQGSTLERGYNTNGTTQFDTQKQGTKAILLSDLPTITVDNTTYYEFRIDLNESSSTPQIALSKLQVFQSNASNLTGYNSTTGQLGGLNPVINLNGTVLLNASLNSGSGVGDVLVYLPGSAFTGNPYIYTYAEFQNADSGFEEFSYANTTALGPLADLSLTQTVSNTALSLGDTVTFTIALNNSGPANATGVKVKDLLPSGINFTNATSSIGTYNNQTGIWDVGNVASGSNATLTLTGTIVNAASASAYTNVAEIVAAKQFDPDSAVNNNDPTEDDYTSIVAPVVKLDLSKKFTSVTPVDGDGNGTPEQFIALPGDNVSFQITVTNNGADSATDVKIKDDLTKVLPVGLTVQSLGLDGGINLDASGGGDGNSQTVEVLFNNIAPGASKTITVNAKVSTDYITPISFSGTLGTSNPSTGNLNTALPEYYETTFDATLFLNYNVTKSVNEGRANFGFLNITSDAEIVSVNQQNLVPGTIKASGRLDVSSYAIQGVLNNGQPFKVFSIENLNNPNSSNPSFFLNPDPDGGGGSSGYPYYNQSEFLQSGQTGVAGFFGEWAKINDPAYLAALATWMNLSADGNLSDTQDEQAVINALADFIESGVYQQDRFSGGSFTFNNGTQTQNLNFEGGEISPIGTSFVNILVTDTGAFVTDSNGNPIGSFADLQAALDSFNFANPTGINVTIQDSSGDGLVQTRLRELGGFYFDGNWSIKNITVNSNVSQVSFVSGNNAADVDFSLPNFVLPTNTTVLNLRGDNSGDQITGTRYGDRIEGLNGTDVLSGLGGNDTINGGLAQDTLIGGRGDDSLTGGSGNDRFVFGAIFGNDTITDFVGQDKIDLRQLKLSSSALDSNGDGIINAIDNLADLIGGSLKLDLTSLNGGTISLTGVTSVNMAAVVL